MSSMPPPRALTSAIRSTYAAGCTASRPPGRPPVRARARARASRARELLLDRADARRALGMLARVVLERGGMVEVEAAGHGVGRAGTAPPAADTVPPGDPPAAHRVRRRRRRRRRRGRPVRRAGRGRAAARAWCSCPARRWRSRRATGRRAGLRPRWTLTTPSTCTWPTRCAAGRGATAARGRDPLRRGAGAGARAGAARDLVRPLGRRRAAAVPGGRPLAAPGRPRRRQRDRPAGDCARCPSW